MGCIAEPRAAWPGPRGWIERRGVRLLPRQLDSRETERTDEPQETEYWREYTQRDDVSHVSVTCVAIAFAYPWRIAYRAGHYDVELGTMVR